MKLGVCVPYRNREEHMNIFVPHVTKFLEERGIEHTIYLAHQCDDKLFNRGLMKNIAAKHAFDDGCDYIVWHDIDMVPEDNSCDYSFPNDNPQHIAVNISQSDYMLKYEEYFGGAVIFSKEQVEKTNGYSNDYWDWGMEDDDLFWRCVKEGYVNHTILDFKNKTSVGHFNGRSSKISFPPTNDLRNAISNSHTVSILVKAEQQIEKVPIYLIGDMDRRFAEYPIFRKPGFDWGISFNNSRAYTSMMWDRMKGHLYQWIKRYENQWSWVTLSVDIQNKLAHFYLNGKESDARLGTGTLSPLQFKEPLKRYGMEDFYIGYSPNTTDSKINYFKGNISKIKVWNKCLTSEEIQNLHKKDVDDSLILDISFDDFTIEDKKRNVNLKIKNVELIEENIEIPNTILPHRRPGKFLCLPHQTEGLINIGGTDKWAKGETTARNEKRYILEMQQGGIDYKLDGINNMKYKYINTDIIFDKHKLINVKTI
jgi:hypothetical protein